MQAKSIVSYWTHAVSPLKIMTRLSGTFNPIIPIIVSLTLKFICHSPFTLALKIAAWHIFP